MLDEAEVAGIAAVATVVAEREPTAGRYPERTEMVAVPILFIGKEDLIVPQAGGEDIAFAADVLRAEIVFFERDIERIRVGRDGVGLVPVVAEAGAVPDA